MAMELTRQKSDGAVDGAEGGRGLGVGKGRRKGRGAQGEGGDSVGMGTMVVEENGQRQGENGLGW